MPIDRANLVGNIETFLIVIDMQTRPYIRVQRGSIFPYYFVLTRGVLFCVGDFAHATDDRHQT